MAWGKTEQNQPSGASPVLHPVDRARTAYGNGDRFFQTQLVVTM